ncbi:3-deoxy-7-phosphoheptulonate synthase [Actinospica robiniae]|uniref:3-deoxy-7-phosphoheptulonate synthase n=1 Tax=Actinospica robiniae TaxID=304901 RepID=UPI0004218E89|nr:3-deoxy-7-phosphoheptulonate synthase [Actinospica robiniae]
MATLLAFAADGARLSNLRGLTDRLAALGARTTTRSFRGRVLLVVDGPRSEPLGAELAASDQITQVLDTAAPHPLASRAAWPQDSVVRIGDAEFGGSRPVLIAGPCSAENPDVLLETAAAVKAAGASMLRVGIFKPRTSPYSFQGLGRAGISALSAVRAEHGLPVVSELISVRDLDVLPGVADLIQIGARNMQNYPLLAEVARAGRPLLLKRGFAATVGEWLNAAEYLLAHGASEVVLCERGIRTFEPATRFTLDLGAVPVVKELSHLPVIVDPSHAAGSARLVPALAAAGLAAGADGLIIEVHPRPHEALSDGEQSLDLPGFAALADRLRALGTALGRPLTAAEASEPQLVSVP